MSETLTLIPALDMRAERIRGFVNGARVCIIEAGRELIGAKDECAHGEWLSWLDREFGWSDKTAENYMNVFRAFANSKELSNFTSEALYLLAAPKVPDGVREEAIEKANEGERVGKKQAQQMIADALEAQRQQFEERLETAEQEWNVAEEDDKARLHEEIQNLKRELAARKQKAKPAEQSEDEIKRHREQRTTHALGDALSFFHPRKKLPEQWAKELIEEINLEFWMNPFFNLTVEDAQRCSDALAAFARLWRLKHGSTNNAGKRKTSRKAGRNIR